MSGNIPKPTPNQSGKIRIPIKNKTIKQYSLLKDLSISALATIHEFYPESELSGSRISNSLPHTTITPVIRRSHWDSFVAHSRNLESHFFHSISAAILASSKPEAK